MSDVNILLKKQEIHVTGYTTGLVVGVTSGVNFNIELRDSAINGDIVRISLNNSLEEEEIRSITI